MAQYCMQYGCPDAAGPPVKLTPSAYRLARTAKKKSHSPVRKAETGTAAGARNEKTKTAAKILPSPLPESAGKESISEEKIHPQADAAVAPIPPSPSLAPADSAVKRAQEIVAAKMRNAAAVEFVNVRRVSKETIAGKTIDSVCGRVKGQRASDGKAGDWPFVYLIDEDKAYIVGDNPDTLAGISYRNICGAPAPKRMGEISAT